MKNCCGTIQYLIDDARVDTDGGLYVWTSRVPKWGDWEPERLALIYCPTCGKKVEMGNSITNNNTDP